MIVSTLQSELCPTLFVEALFDETYSDQQSVLVAQALIIAAPNYPEIKPLLLSWNSWMTLFKLP